VTRRPVTLNNVEYLTRKLLLQLLMPGSRTNYNLYKSCENESLLRQLFKIVPADVFNLAKLKLVRASEKPRCAVTVNRPYDVYLFWQSKSYCTRPTSAPWADAVDSVNQLELRTRLHMRTTHRATEETLARTQYICIYHSRLDGNSWSGLANTEE
jgi:hypothetical protein